MTQQTRTLVFPRDNELLIDRLRVLLQSEGFNLRNIQHAVVSGQLGSDTITLYSTGRLVVQSQDIERLLALIVPLLGKTIETTNELRNESQNPTSSHDKRWIGTDESGKGDYFGPLIIAGVLLDSSSALDIAALGTRDSKTLSDNVVQRIANDIRKRVPNSVVVIGPRKYNELYEKMGNLNALLAWGHARCIENILENNDAVLAIADQFGDEAYITSALMNRGKQIRLEQRPHAEEDLAVAAASILARSRFVLLLQSLSREVGINLPKGAGSEVEAVAKQLVAKRGPDVLLNLVKYHFRTTAKVLSH